MTIPWPVIKVESIKYLPLTSFLIKQDYTDYTGELLDIMPTCHYVKNHRKLKPAKNDHFLSFFK